MIYIEKSTMNLELVIGDTGSFSLKPKINKETYLSEGDKIYFTVKKKKTGDVVLNKEITEFRNGIVDIVIESKDTLDLEPGNYIYDIKSVRKDGTVDTLIPNNPSASLTLKRGVKSWK